MPSPAEGGVRAPRAGPSGSCSTTWPDPIRQGRSLRPDAAASLVVLRPREGAALDAASVDLEAVFVDGREPSGWR